MEPDAIALLSDAINDLLKFIMDNHQRFIQEEYENATPEYLSLSKVF